MTASQIESTTRNRGWERFAPAGALGFLLTIAIGALVIGEGTPSSKAPTEEIAAYFAEHRSEHFLNATLVVMGAFALYPWFLASLYRAILRAEGDDGIFAVVALIGGLAWAGLLLAPLMIVAGVVGLFPPLMFSLFGPWLVAVAFSLMFRPVGAGVAVRSTVTEPTAGAP